MAVRRLVMKKAYHWLIIYLFLVLVSSAGASEVIEETPTQVVVREHPKTGHPYVNIVSAGVPAPNPFESQRKKMARPDYQLLDPKIKAGEIPYEGPSSDRKKVYLFAASLATLGTVGGVVGMALAPAAAGAGASGGAGAYLAGGAAVTAGTVAGSVAATRADPKKDDYIHTSQSQLLEDENKREFSTSSGQ